MPAPLVDGVASPTLIVVFVLTLPVELTFSNAVKSPEASAPEALFA
jgi:hypothetical protein